MIGQIEGEPIAPTAQSCQEQQSANDQIAQLQQQVVALRKALQSAHRENQSAKKKLRVQRSLISHLRQRLAVATGLELHEVSHLSNGGVAGGSRVDSMNDALQRIQRVQRSHGNSSATQLTALNESIPGIDPSEFLPLDHGSKGLPIHFTGLMEYARKSVDVLAQAIRVSAEVSLKSRVGR